MYDDESWRGEGNFRRALGSKLVQIGLAGLLILSVYRVKGYFERMNRRLLTLEAILLDPRPPLGG